MNIKNYNENGNITWYDGYEPLEDEFHLSVISNYGNRAELEGIKKSS